FELFRKTMDTINKDVISFLFKADIPQQQTIQEARQVQRPKENYATNKEEIPNTEQARQQAGQAGQTQRPQVTETIVRDAPKINRNDTVTIKHVMSGKTEEMKYKKAEPMLKTGEWVLV